MLNFLSNAVNKQFLVEEITEQWMSFTGQIYIFYHQLGESAVWNIFIPRVRP